MLGQEDTERMRMPGTYVDLFLQRIGPRDEVMKRAGIFPELLAAPDGTMAVGDMYRCLEILSPAEADPIWHLKWTGWLQDRFHGPLSLALLTAPDLGSGLTTLVKFLADRVPFLEFDSSRAKTLFYVEIRPHWVPENDRFDLIELAIGTIYNYVASFAARDMREAKIFLERPEPSFADQFREWFAAKVEFGRIQTRIAIPSEWLAVANPEYDEASWAAALSKCEAASSRTLGSNAVQHVRRILLSALYENPALARIPTLNDIANDLNMSRRTLIRHLKEAGHSYTEILSEIQKSRVVRLLRSQELTISEVGARLGYQDPANFGRAFRRWFSVSPSEYRRTMDAAN